MTLIQQTIRRVSSVKRTPRVIQLEGRYDLSPLAEESAEWNVDVTLPATWNVGVIVGGSGSGKTTISRVIAEKLGAILQTPRNVDGDLAEPHVWPADQSVIEGVAGSDGSIEDAMLLLSSVGFASPPAWRRPFASLSFGQQFRASLARTLAESIVDKRPRMVDEYSSVIDRQVAQIGSAAVAKTARRYGLQFVAVTCHRDVIDWLEPDWVIECHDDRTVSIAFADGDGSARRWVRPRIDLRIVRVDPACWPRFAPHHYLSHDLIKHARSFVGMIDGSPAAFVAVQHYPHSTLGLTFREHRLVTLPDFQGVGIGSRMSDAIAAMMVGATGRPYYSLTSHPALIQHRIKSDAWRTTRRRGESNGWTGADNERKRNTSVGRLTSAFQFVGPPDERGGRMLGMHRFIETARVNSGDGRLDS